MLRPYVVQLRVTKLETFQVDGIDAHSIVGDFQADPNDTMHIHTTIIGVCTETKLETMEVVSVKERL